MPSGVEHWAILVINAQRLCSPVLAPFVIRRSRQAIVMMQATQHGDRDDTATPAKLRVIAANRYPLTNSLVRPRLVEINERVFPQHSKQVPLAQDDHEVEALASDATEESLAGCVHQGRTRRGFQHASRHALGHAVELRTVLVVAIADDDLRPVAKRSRISDLLRRPLLGRMARRRDVEVGRWRAEPYAEVRGVRRELLRRIEAQAAP